MRLRILILIIIVSVHLSCENSSDNLPGYSGKSGEVVVVMDKGYWNSTAGKTIKSIIGKAQYGLPQGEPLFDITNIPHRSFTRIFQVHRNIFIANISDEFVGKEPFIEVKKSVWSKGQLVIQISSPDQKGFISLLAKHAEDISRHFLTEEIKRLTAKNRKFGSTKLSETLKAKHGFSLIFQEKTKLVAEGENFAWFRLERERPAEGYEHQISQGIMVYYYNYTDTGMLTTARLLAVRDSITKQYIPGPTAESYMITSDKLFLPESHEINFSGTYAIETRGLWRMENYFMGGPFVSLTTVDERKQRVITIDGYVFAPQFSKRDYLREVEAVIKSLEY